MADNKYLQALERYKLKISQRSQEELSIENRLEKFMSSAGNLEEQLNNTHDDQEREKLLSQVGAVEAYIDRFENNTWCCEILI